MLLTQASALVLIDLQHDYLNAEGLQPHPGLITSQASALLQAARSNNIPVIHVWTTIRPDGSNRMPHWQSADRMKCVAGTTGHSVPEPLAPAGSEIVVHKSFFSAFSVPELDRALNELEIDTLILAGVHLHACVRATALDAYQRGLKSVIAEDAIGSDDVVHAAITRRYLAERSSSFASTNHLVEWMKGDATHPLTDQRQDNLTVSSPSDPDSVWTVKQSSGAEINNTVARTVEAREQLVALDFDERIARSLKAADHLEAAAEELVRQIVREIGKPIVFARAEVAAAVEMIRKIASRLVAETQTTLPGVVRRPLGTVALISPWNNPVFIPIGKIIPALIFGNSVVWKPSEHTTQVSRIVRETVERAFGQSLLTLVEGAGSVGAALVANPSIDGVTFTGSGQTGLAIQEVCNRRFVPFQAEMGGNNAVIVDRSADVQLAARLVAFAAFGQAGQRCTATRRAIVYEDDLAGFLRNIKTSTKLLMLGDPGKPETVIGPLITNKKRLDVESLLARAAGRVRLTERLEVAGDQVTSTAGHNFLSPVVLVVDDPLDEVVQEELFAPVLVVQACTSFRQAIELCNGVRQGLAASLFSNDPENIEMFLERAQAGIVKVNQATDGAGIDMPFGGWKASGVGPAEHGESDVEFYTRVQSVYR